MSDWRQNPNLVECYENCVAMFRRMPVSVPSILSRRLALGLTQKQLAKAAGYARESSVFAAENGERGPAQKVSAALDRLEAERAQAAE